MYISSHCQRLCNLLVADILCTEPYKGLGSFEYHYCPDTYSRDIVDMYAVYFCAGFQEQPDVSPVKPMKTR
jgi:hypothetical protein